MAGADNRFDTSDDVVSSPENVRADATANLNFKLDQAGTYNFRCDFHPTEMMGTITVQ
jgi:plastocyanin